MNNFCMHHYATFFLYKQLHIHVIMKCDTLPSEDTLVKMELKIHDKRTLG